MKKIEIPYFDELPYWSAPFGITLINSLKIKKGINILDIGSGTGFPLIELAQMYGLSSQIYGVEPRQDAINIINKKIKLQNIKNATVRKCKAERMPFRDEFFDLIVSNNGINNVDNEIEVLSECFRVSKKGAQIHLTMNMPSTMKEFYNTLFQSLHEFNMNESIKNIKKLIRIRRKTTAYWKVVIKNAGFKEISVKRDKFFYRYTDGLTFLNSWFVQEAYIKPIKAIVSNELIDEALAKTEKKLNLVALSEGELKMSIPFVCLSFTK